MLIIIIVVIVIIISIIIQHWAIILCSWPLVAAQKQRINCCVMLWSTYSRHTAQPRPLPTATPTPLWAAVRQFLACIFSLILAALIARARSAICLPSSLPPFTDFLFHFFFTFLLPPSRNCVGCCFSPPFCMHLLIICAFYSAGKLFSKRTWNYLCSRFFPKINHWELFPPQRSGCSREIPRTQ